MTNIANTERLSLSGRLARPVADAWLTQWAHLARPGGPDYIYALLTGRAPFSTGVPMRRSEMIAAIRALA